MAVRTRKTKGQRTGPVVLDRQDDRVFKALSNADRRQMLDLLRDGPATTGDLCDAFPRLDRCTVMLHLRVLTRADLVIAKRRGRNRWNYLNVSPIQQIYERWIREYARPAAQLLAQWKKQIES